MRESQDSPYPKEIPPENLLQLQLCSCSAPSEPSPPAGQEPSPKSSCYPLSPSKASRGSRSCRCPVSSSGEAQSPGRGRTHSRASAPQNQHLPALAQSSSCSLSPQPPPTAPAAPRSSEAPGDPPGLGRIQAGARQAREAGHVPAELWRGARTEPRAGALLGAALKCMSCAGPNDEQSCQTRSLSQLIISNESRVSGSPRSWAAASHSAQLQHREKISKCHCAGLAAQSLIRQI